MEYIRVTKENIDKEHICCAIANNKDIQVISKKTWLQKQFEEGLVFLKGDIRGKCFIEYIPAENAWVPIKAENYMHINCFWVSGSCKGHGYANELLEQCILDTAKPYFTLMCLSFDDNAEVPQFKDCAKVPQTDKEGFTLYYTSGCPYTAKYVPIIENYALSNGIPFRSVHLDSKEKVPGNL